ncbi:GNAT family N-acetyltransferase [Actinosynnema sp. NPDC020468]|uniref:helix-turn-helix domain-containing GNAT family N-acetyltransferase n=1 Tax=Actinosynnema sp. NPDC020468 TaxID=3154488 RepID=UPI0033F2DB5F
MTTSPSDDLAPRDAAAYAEWFARLADPVRIRLLHLVAGRPDGIAVDALAGVLGVSPSTCAHHLDALAGLLLRRGDRVSVDPAGRTALPLADVLLGTAARRSPVGPSTEVVVRALAEPDWADVLRVHVEGIATGHATFDTDTPGRAVLDARWLADHRWVAEVDGRVVGWAAASPVSARECYSGVAETSVYVGEGARGRGVGRALLHRQVTAADDGGLWTLQTAIFPENRASVALHHAAGFRTVGLRERVARHRGAWRDTVLLERRSAAGNPSLHGERTGGARHTPTGER